MLRAHLECEVAVNADHTHRIRVHNLHLAARFGERANGEERRMRELGAILGDIRHSGHAPHLLLGDFNAVAPGDVVAASDFFARLDGKPGQLGGGVAQICRLRARPFDPRLFARALGLETPHPRVGGAHFGGRKVQAAIGID